MASQSVDIFQHLFWHIFIVLVVLLTPNIFFCFHSFIHLFMIDKFKEEGKTNIKMYKLGMYQLPLSVLLEEVSMCPECSDNFKNIGEQIKHCKKYQFIFCC